MASQIFDCLIDDGKEPKSGMEYIYNHNMAWPIYREDDSRSSDFADGNKDPEVNSQEELDNLECRPYSIKVKKGIIVTDVISLKHPTEGYHRGYEFTIKESGIRCHCNYPWAFWENTAENIFDIIEYKSELKKLNDQQRLIDRLRKNIDQLTIKK